MTATPRVLIVFAIVACAVPAEALDRVSMTRAGKTRQIAGRVLTEAEDGGLLVQDRESVLWAVQPEELENRRSDDTAFTFMDAGELQERLVEELPTGFDVHPTAHYLILYNTSPAYAEWCGALYERLYWAFQNYWRRKGLQLVDPPQPLVALVFDTQQSYARYAQAELGDATGRIVGYYSLRTNRMTMYDLTGTRGLQHARRLNSTAQINALLLQPHAERMVATIIHEATHQLAFNCGMHHRYADIPYWVSEGIAVYFETPDLRSSTGWRSIGGIHRDRLARFRQALPNRPQNSLSTLIGDDDRFLGAETALDAYAEAWSLNYYLLKRRPAEYVRYLQSLADKPPMIYDTAEQRLAAFTEAFGESPEEMNREFLRYILAVR